MCNKLTLILGISFLFFHLWHDKNQRTLEIYWGRFHKPELVTLKKHLDQKFSRNITQSSAYKLTLSYIFGLKKYADKELKEAHKNLKIIHLFTPSGLHLSSLFLFLRIFVRARGPTLTLFTSSLTLTLLVLLQFITGYAAIKRILFLKLILQFFGDRLLIKNVYFFFILCFVIDFVWGTAQENLLSFAFSFMYLGTILSTIERSLMIKLFALSLCFAIEGIYFEQKIYLLAIPLSYFLSWLFIIIFPLIILLFVFSYTVPSYSGLLLSLLEPLIVIIKELDTLIKMGPVLQAHLSLTIGLVSLIYLFQKPRFGIVVLVATILISMPSPLGIHNTYDINFGKKTYKTREFLKEIVP